MRSVNAVWARPRNFIPCSQLVHVSDIVVPLLACSVSLSSECDSLHELNSSACGQGEKLSAFGAIDGGLGVGEDGGDVSALRFDIHEERFGCLHQSLELVLSLLLAGVDVNKVHVHCAFGYSGIDI